MGQEISQMRRSNGISCPATDRLVCPFSSSVRLSGCSGTGLSVYTTYCI